MVKNQYEETLQVYISWMIDMIRKIQKYTDGITYEEFIDNEMMIDAVLTPTLQLGEISAKIKRLEYMPFEIDLPIKEMTAMKNLLVHNYIKIDTNEVRKVIKNQLPSLKVKLLQIAKDNNIE